MSASLLEKIRKNRLKLLSLILFLCPLPMIAQSETPSEYTDTLNPVVIAGDKVSMVVRGDTTVYDASCYTVLKGASLKDLLLTLPGITIKDDAIYANGERIERILVNGEPLFLNDTKAALRLLYAAEIKDLKVYDQRNPMDYMVRDSLDRKGRVVDVRTKKKMESIQDFFAGISMGHYQAGSLTGSIQSYALNKPSIGLDIAYYRNTPDVTTTPGDKVIVLSTTGIADKKRKLNLHNSLNFQFDLVRNSFGAESQYVGDLLGWADVSDARSRTSTFSVNESFHLEKTLGEGRDKMEWQLMLNWQRNNNLSSTYRRMSSGSTESIVDLNTDKLENVYGISTNLGWTHKFAKSGRLLRPSIFLVASSGTGDGSRKDTLAVSSKPMQIELDASRWKAEVGASLVYREPFTKASSLNFDYKGSANVNDAQQSSLDLLNASIDGINTFDYISISVKNSAGLAYIYKTRNTELRIGGKFNDEYRNVREHYPSDNQRNNSYWSLTPDFLMNYRKGKIRIKAEVSGHMSIPTIEQTREHLDNSTALYLTCGNPSLRQSTTYDVSLSQNYTSTRLQTIFNIKTGLSLAHNFITQDVSLMQTETYLAEYDYTCPVGSRLVRPVNVQGQMAAYASLSADIKSAPLKSTFSPTVSADYTRTPFLIDGIESYNPMFRVSGGLRYVSSFSSRYLLSIGSQLDYSRYYQKTTLLYNSITGDVSADFKANPIGGLWIKPSFSYQGRKTFNGFDTYNNCNLSASVSYKFGRNANMEVGVRGYDLLNNNKWESLISSDIVITRSWSNMLGRTVLLFFSWRFR